MPTIGPFHGMYWRFSDTSVAPLAKPYTGYPSWQASVVSPSMIVFGPSLDALQVFWRYLQWLWALLRWGAHVPPADRVWTIATLERLSREGPEQRVVLEHVLDSLHSPHWPQARIVVRETAQTKGFNHPEAWIPYSRAMKADPGQAENTFRHLRSVHALRGSTVSSTIGNPEAHLLIELAYHGLAQVGR